MLDGHVEPLALLERVIASRRTEIKDAIRATNDLYQRQHLGARLAELALLERSLIQLFSDPGADT